MKKLFLTVLVYCQLPIAYCQLSYWQQRVDYSIDVSLNDSSHTLDGFEKITYTNQSPDTLTYIWFHLWPNAYKNDRTAYSEQALRNGSTKFYFASRDQRGYINRLNFKVDGTPARTEDHPEHIDIIKLVLPDPLPPGRQVGITTPFHIKLPYNFSRGGHEGQSYQVTQWYPKPAVYDRNGWHAMPYLDQGEFYSEFGSFDVRITLPDTYTVAATGILQEGVEKGTKYEVRNTKEGKGKKAPVKNAPPRPPLKKNTPQVKKAPPAEPPPTTNYKPRTYKTVHFQQDSVHDFAWFADKDFIVNRDTCALPSGRVIDVATYYTPAQEKYWKNSLQFCKDAVRFYSSEVGEYPYSVLRAVQGPKSFGGGMEYPTITVISPIPSEKELDQVLAHEIGHNWFYGILGSNEREHPWMDEGLNSYYDHKYAAQKYGSRQQLNNMLLQTRVAENSDQPIEAPAPSLHTINYFLVTYHKTALWLQQLEQAAGPAAFRQAMQDYYTRWRFRHPQPEDFKTAFRPVLGTATDSLFHLQTEKGFGQPAHKGWSLVSPLAPSSLRKYGAQPPGNLLLVTPAPGYNAYDGLMLGPLVTNYGLPPSKLQFLALPLYGTHSKKWNGLGRVSYSVYPDNRFRLVELAVSGMKFSQKEGLDTNGKRSFESFYRLTPSLTFFFREDVQSSRNRSLELKTFFISENNFSNRVTRRSDNKSLFVDSMGWSRRYINQVSFTETNTRALYPYDYQLQAQQGEGWYRLNATAHYFFNYAGGGGLNLRLFAAHFGTLGSSRPLSTYLYRPKLLGVTGEEDYTYSNYFMGRTASFAYSGDDPVENKGIAARQIMLRDGAFKLRADQYEFLQGRSGNWVAALNLSTSLPKKLMPLPLKLFLDAGTYSEAWQPQDETGNSRFLYVAGLQVPLLKNLVNVYVPVLSSKLFRDNLSQLPEQRNWLRRWTFSLDIHRINHRFLLDRKSLWQ
ncbi:M1 family metallopeptidase [Paraflavisolibacter sp. H34]|uniref:M1 family metallopeptidase n=1 Tax=Huijunlia imazamoxiresistens TaxID=3127457 RepID=UPI0030198352